MNVYSRRLYSFLLALGLGMGAAACGSSTSSPTAPSVSAASAGATLQGTVVGGVAGASAGLGSVHALSTKAGIQVSVTGTALVTMTDSSGKFVLTGVPAGPVELRFEGAGVNARLTVSGLTPGQTLTITVNVNGGQATLVPEGDEGGVDFKGPIQSIDVGAGSLMVGGRKVTTNADTRIMSGDETRVSLSTLKVGATVEVQGTTQADMSVLAKTIQLQESQGDDGGEVELKGKIQSINTAAGTLVVAGKTVATDSSTRIKRGDTSLTLKDLKVNDSVEVQGTSRADGTILAKHINLEGGGD
jgi:hypothetical protein